MVKDIRCFSRLDRDCEGCNIPVIVVPDASFVYGITNSLTITTVFFTLGRGILFITLGMLVPHRTFTDQIITEIKFESTLLFVNVFYVSVFGDFFESLLEKGVSFSWPLFLFATLIIIVFYRRPARNKKSITKKLLRKAVRVMDSKKRVFGNESDEIDLIRDSVKNIETKKLR